MGKYLSSRVALEEMGNKIKAYRIDYPLTQKELSEKSGVAVRSIMRMESGEDVQFGNFIKILMALDLDNNLDLLVPNSTQRPSYYLEQQGKKAPRKRVRKKSSAEGAVPRAKWGDEE